MNKLSNGDSVNLYLAILFAFKFCVQGKKDPKIMQADDTRHANVFYKNDNQTVQLKPEDNLSFHENGPFFLQSSQPLKEVSKKLYMQYFFASSLSFCDGALLYVSLPCLTQDLTFVLDVNRSYTLEAVTPGTWRLFIGFDCLNFLVVPCPLPVQFNSKINDPSQTCFCSVFSRTFASGPLRFLFSFEKKFSDCSDFLRTSLKNNGFVSPKICLLNPDSETEELISISSFFSNPGNALSQIYIVAQSDCECKLRRRIMSTLNALIFRHDQSWFKGSCAVGAANKAPATGASFGGPDRIQHWGP